MHVVPLQQQVPSINVQDHITSTDPRKSLPGHLIDFVFMEFVGNISQIHGEPPCVASYMHVNSHERVITQVLDDDP